MSESEKREIISNVDPILGESARKHLVCLTEEMLPFYPLILCFVTGKRIPDYCVSMKRLPEISVGALFDLEFTHVLKSGVAKNPSIHDGAIILTRQRPQHNFKISGWSYRLVPPHSVDHEKPNRGSAYNSAISMSLVDAVDAVFLASRDSYTLFINGKEFLEGHKAI